MDGSRNIGGNNKGFHNNSGRMSSVLAFTLSVILIFTGALTTAYGDAGEYGTAQKMKAPATQPFDNFDEVGKTIPGVSGSGYEQPVMDEDPVNDADYGRDSGSIRAFALQPSYLATPYITPVKNQGVYGNCWSFAALASVEGSIIKSGLRSVSDADLSPFHLVNGVYNSYTFRAPAYPVITDPLADMMHAGGNSYRAEAAMSKGFGPKLWGAEDTALFPSVSNTSIKPLTGFAQLNSFDYRLSDMNIIPSPRGSDGEYRPENVEAIKAALTGYGPLATSYRAADYHTEHSAIPAFFYDEKTGEDREADHAVTIVGWNDEYPKSNFAPAVPPADGAFRIKNSWGTGEGESGYFWLSYYEGSFGASFYFSAVDKSRGDTIFSLDALGAMGAAMGYTRTKDWMANKFTVPESSSPQQLSAATVFCMVPGTTYKVSAYKNPTAAGDPESGKPLEIGSDTPASVIRKIDYAGFHTIDFAKPVIVGPGDTFTIVVEVQKLSASDYSIPCEAKLSAGDAGGAALISPGESYTVGERGNWEDFYSFAASEGAGNVNVKAVSLTTSLASLSPVQTGAVIWIRGSDQPLSTILLDATFATGITERVAVGEPGVKLTGVNPKVSGSYTGKATYCGKSADVKVNVVDKVTDIRTPLATVYLKKGAVYSLPAVAYEGNTAVKAKLIYASSDPNTVKVSGAGKLTASKSVAGKKKATITISSESGYKKNLTVYVVPKAKKLSRLIITGISSTMKKGQYKNLKVKLSPAAATGVKVAFASSKKSVLAVDKAGKIYAKKKGSAYVTVKAGGKTFRKKVTVK